MQVIIIITLSVLFLFFILCPTAVLTATQTALNLWWNNLVPALLPFFILNALLIRSGSLKIFGKLLKKPLHRFFRLPGEAAFLFLAGYSTGAPVAAGLVRNLRERKLISKSQADILLPATANASPGFILSAVAVSMLQNEACGIPLLLTCYGSNLLLATVSLGLCGKSSRQREPAIVEVESVASSADSLEQIIFRSCQTLIFIGGTVMLCYIFIAFLTEIGIFAYLQPILPYPWGEILTPLSSGILEITAGSQLLSALEVPLTLKLPLVATVLSFGGLSAALQIKNEIRNTDISLGHYLAYKIIQGAVAFTVSLLILTIPAPVWTETVQTQTRLWHDGIFPLLLPGIYLLVSLLSLVFRFLWDGEH